jgi:hypothetical protein
MYGSALIKIVHSVILLHMKSKPESLEMWTLAIHYINHRKQVRYNQEKEVDSQ